MAWTMSNESEPKELPRTVEEYQSCRPPSARCRGRFGISALTKLLEVVIKELAAHAETNYVFSHSHLMRRARRGRKKCEKQLPPEPMSVKFEGAPEHSETTIFIVTPIPTVLDVPIHNKQ
ncbi:hypothetical protein R3P38DRAFT_2775712 [Favolaschia claudopus]|uniref:Uncharacterized protein n=1 Tax=Favolaschia claudopus TaxID=2862362 RepID=A0AAW0BQX2_9AGAR